MNVANLLTETATVTSRNPTGTRDDYGVVLTASATRTTQCWHQQTNRNEFGSISDQTWDGYFPPGDPLKSTDAVTIAGISFEVVGGPWQTLNPRTGDPWQVEATLRRTDG